MILFNNLKKVFTTTKININKYKDNKKFIFKSF